jgi:hypothetical protein
MATSPKSERKKSPAQHKKENMAQRRALGKAHVKEMASRPKRTQAQKDAALEKGRAHFRAMYPNG